MSTLIDDCTQFIKDLILGDFNEKQMVSAQLIGGVISLIPVVDQVMDVRDIAGCLYRINGQGGMKSATLEQKVDLGFAAFGVIPEIGSAFKTVFKPLYKQRKAVKGAIAGGVEMFERMYGLRKGGAVRWVQKLDWVGNTNNAIYKADLALESCIELLKHVASDPWWCPDELARMAMDVTPGMVSLRGQLAKPIREASQEINAFVVDMLGEHAAAVALGALGNAGGSRTSHHGQGRASGGTARTKPEAHNEQGKPGPHKEPASKPVALKKPTPHEELKEKPRVVVAKKTGTVATAVTKRSYETYQVLDFMKKGLLGEHIVDHHVIEQKKWGLDWNRHDMIGGAPGIKLVGWQGPPRKLNDNEIPMYLCTPSMRVLLHGIDSAWITNRPYPQQYAMVEAKTNQNPNVSLLSLLGEASNPASPGPRLTPSGKPSRAKRKPPTKFMQMSEQWIELYVLKQLSAHRLDIFRGGRNYTRHVFLVTPMQTLEHIYAMTKILDAGFANQPARAQVFAKDHAVHNVQKEFDEVDLDKAEQTYKKSGKPKRGPKKPRKGAK